MNFIKKKKMKKVIKLLFIIGLVFKVVEEEILDCNLCGNFVGIVK